MEVRQSLLPGVTRAEQRGEAVGRGGMGRQRTLPGESPGGRGAPPPARKQKHPGAGPCSAKGHSASRAKPSTRKQSKSVDRKTRTTAPEFGRDRMGPSNMGKRFQQVLCLHHQRRGHGQPPITFECKSREGQGAGEKGGLGQQPGTGLHQEEPSTQTAARFTASDRRSVPSPAQTIPTSCQELGED